MLKEITKVTEEAKEDYRAAQEAHFLRERPGRCFGATLRAMFCPQCRVEYRPGFTHCTDCDVDLVNDYVSGAGYQEVRKRELPYELSTQLWHGADPQFYLTLIDSLANRKVPCFGRPVSPPMYDSFEEQPPGSSSAVEFEVLVSEENLPFAPWVLSSEEEWFHPEDEQPAKAVLQDALNGLPPE